MIAEIITTGEEVLSGQILDTNAVWLSQWLAEHGLRLVRRSTVGDRMEDLVSLLRERSQVADVVIVNGGLGPTIDDLSAQAAAEAADQPLVTFQEWVDALEEKFSSWGRPMPPRNLKQALLPKNATLLDNPVGTACGWVMPIGKALVYFTPGPPIELKRMMAGQVWPHLKSKTDLQPQSFLKKMNTLGLPEARVDELFADLAMPAGFQLGFRAHFPFIETKIMAWGQTDEASAGHKLALADEIRRRLGQFLVYEDEESLAGWLLREMRSAGFTLALAESCTGGLVASQLVSVPDSSAFFDRGMVTYSNQAKIDMVDVPPEVLAEHGAVSLQTARAMAIGAKKRAGTTHALSITGIAGPGGGSEEKPIGTVGFSLATPNKVYSQLLRLPKWGRSRIRLISAAVALDMLRRKLVDVPVFANFDYAPAAGTDISPMP